MSVEARSAPSATAVSSRNRNLSRPFCPTFLTTSAIVVGHSSPTVGEHRYTACRCRAGCRQAFDPCKQKVFDAGASGHPFNIVPDRRLDGPGVAPDRFEIERLLERKAA